MKIEASTTFQEQPAQLEQSIFDFYSVENEVAFADKLSSLPEDERNFYIKESVFRFLNEFAGKIPYTKISFKLKPDGLEYSGIKTTPIYEKTSQMAGTPSREEDELTGYRRVEDALQLGYGATWISPPKDANYGFVFHFQRNPDNTVDEYILMYDEEKGSVFESEKLLKAIDPGLQRTDTSDFLRRPIESDNPDLDLEKILLYLGIDEEEIEKSRSFEKTIRDRLEHLIDNGYIQALLNGNVNMAKKLLSGYFNYAKEMQEGLDKMSAYFFTAFFKKDVNADNDNILKYYSSFPATVIGGGSCPVTKANGGSSISGYDITNSLLRGNSVEKSASSGDNYPDYECPHCHKTLSGERKNDKSSWRKQCDHCGGSLGC